MTLELLAPARTAETGIDAVNAGADAVYIGGPDFGARKAAGNSIDDIAVLCRHAHRYGAGVFVTFNTRVGDDELDRLHSQMLACQDAGADAFIIRDPRICTWKDIVRPLHASTQCAIRTVEDALRYESLGCSRIVLERQMSLPDIRKIHEKTACEIEFFVHGAICVCYSGECRLSEYINGRSADRGDCMQACRSRYDLIDSNGKILLKDKAVLSLKDYKLLDSLESLAEAGVCSFKIEGRLKNSSYVRNVVREYSLTLDKIIAKNPEKYRRASFGSVTGGFTPDSDKTFNRGYTTLFLNGRQGNLSSADAPKSMGEKIGGVLSVVSHGKDTVELTLSFCHPGITLQNGDGFAFTDEVHGVVGFRGDVCRGKSIVCKKVDGLHPGTVLYRNINRNFEKTMDANPGRRLLSTGVNLSFKGGIMRAEATCENGGVFAYEEPVDALETAGNTERMVAMLKNQISKVSDIYDFRLAGLDYDGTLPLLPSSGINAIRRTLADGLAGIPYVFGERTLFPENADAPSYAPHPLMRSKYCIRYELGLCPKLQGAPDSGPLFLLNGGRRLSLHFDCHACEMTVDSL